MANQLLQCTCIILRKSVLKSQILKCSSTEQYCNIYIIPLPGGPLESQGGVSGSSRNHINRVFCSHLRTVRA